MKQTKFTRTLVTGGSLNPFLVQYAGNYVYEGSSSSNEALQYFSQEEGYIRPINVNSSTVYQYVYQYKDNLGDNRLSYGDDDLYQT